MIYYNVACFGDSQTFGARSYGCYPLYLAQLLKRKSGGRTEYRTINRSVSGYTARDLWFKMNNEIDTISDTLYACVMIGTNDVRKKTDPQLYFAYVSQILLTLAIHGYQQVFVGDIPPVVKVDADPYYPARVEKERVIYQNMLDKAVGKSKIAHSVSMSNLDERFYEDSVHFNELGNLQVAKNFANVMIEA